MTQDIADVAQTPDGNTALSANQNDGEWPSPRSQPVVHPATDPPVCAACQQRELQFFDATCPGCLELLDSNNLTIPEIFAIIRQWTPQTQQNLEILMKAIFRRGGHVDDRDALTDMTMLQYACKAGAKGVGNVDEASRVTSWLIDLGANIYIRSRWTNMAAVHYASYFDVAPVVKLLLKSSKGVVVDAICSDFDNGTPLHICATHLGMDTARALIQNGANPKARDDMGRIPADCVPDPGMYDEDSSMAKLCHRMRRMLQDAEPPPPPSYMSGQDDTSVMDALRALGIRVGDRVVVGGVKTGILRYCGPTNFAEGLWCGIELEEAAGKNNGSVGGISYFRCSPKHGIFAPLSKIAKPGILVHHRPHSSPSARSYPKVNTGKVIARVDTGLSRSGRASVSTEAVDNLAVGDAVLVAGQRKGVVRFCGMTEFAPGLWYGIELDQPHGKNDGCVNDRRYFSCQPKHGVFAPPTRVQRLLDEQVSMESLSSQSLSEKSRLESVSSSQNSTNAAKRSNSHRRANRSPHKSIRETRARGSSSNVSGGPSSKRSWSTVSSGGDFKLAEGMSVFCNNELGVVRYMGPVDFSEGLWLGVELRTPKGKNDGSVQGKRYFSCRPNHGLIVRPSKVTVRGINGAKLLGEQHDTAEKT